MLDTIITWIKMKETILQEKKPPVISVIALISGGLAVLVLTLMPWNIILVQVTEDISVLAVTKYGCVGESELD